MPHETKKKKKSVVPVPPQPSLPPELASLLATGNFAPQLGVPPSPQLGPVFPQTPQITPEQFPQATPRGDPNRFLQLLQNPAFQQLIGHIGTTAIGGPYAGLGFGQATQEQQQFGLQQRRQEAEEEESKERLRLGAEDIKTRQGELLAARKEREEARRQTLDLRREEITNRKEEAELRRQAQVEAKQAEAQFRKEIAQMGIEARKEMAGMLKAAKEGNREVFTHIKGDDGQIYVLNQVTGKVTPSNLDIKPKAATKGLSGEAAKLKGITAGLNAELSELKDHIRRDMRGTLLKIKTGRDRNLTRLTEDIADRMIRLRTGAAATADEVAKFKGLIASWSDIVLAKPDDIINALDRMAAEATTISTSIEPNALQPIAPQTGNLTEGARKFIEKKASQHK